jgi:hypothetical protein
MLNLLCSCLLVFNGLFLIWAVRSGSLTGPLSGFALVLIVAIILGLGWNFLASKNTIVLLVLLFISLGLLLLGWMSFVNQSPSIIHKVSDK